MLLFSCTDDLSETIESEVTTTFTVYSEYPEDGVSPACTTLSYEIGDTVSSSRLISDSSSSLVKTGYYISSLGYFCNAYETLVKSTELPSYVMTSDGDVTGAVTSVSVKLDGAVFYVMKWKEITYTVQFNGNGGTGSMSVQSFTYDESQNLDSIQFTAPNGYTAGYTDNGTTYTWKDSSGNLYTDGQSVTNLASTNGATVTLYALWTASGCFTKIDDGLTVTYPTSTSAKVSASSSGYWVVDGNLFYSSQRTDFVIEDDDYNSFKGTGTHTLVFVPSSGEYLTATFTIP